MEYIKLKARAKINLTLDVLGKRTNGYHDLKMVMQTISLYDGIYIKKINRDGIKLKSNIEWLPVDERNLAVKAAMLLKEKYNIKEGIFIEIDKRIPVAAGLAGGSSDCAAVLVGMNRLFELNIPFYKLMEYGLSLGADVPYCIMRGTALAEGIGEVLTELSSCPLCYIVLVKPPISVSTAFVFKNLNIDTIAQRPDTEKMICAIENKNIDQIANSLCNVLEGVVFPIHGEVKKLKEELLQLGAHGALMSGSGPTVYGLFKNKSEAKTAAICMKNKWGLKDVFITTIYDRNRTKGENKNGRV